MENTSSTATTLAGMTKNTFATLPMLSVTSLSKSPEESFSLLTFKVLNIRSLQSSSHTLLQESMICIRILRSIQAMALSLVLVILDLEEWHCSCLRTTATSCARSSICLSLITIRCLPNQINLLLKLQVRYNFLRVDTKQSCLNNNGIAAPPVRKPQLLRESTMTKSFAAILNGMGKLSVTPVIKCMHKKENFF